MVREDSGLTRRRLLGTGLLGAAAAAVGGCARVAGDLANPTTPAGPDLIIGVSLELTGIGAVAGTAQQRALEIAKDTLNATGVTVGGAVRQVRLTVKDNQSDSTTAADVAQQLLDTRPMGIIGGGLATTTAATAHLAEASGIPVLSTSAVGSVVQPAVGHRFVFKLGPNAADVAALLGTALDREGPDLPLARIGLMAAADAHGEDGTAAVQAMVANTKRTVVATEQLPASSDDYQVQAARMAAAGPDAVVIWAVSPVSGLAARALRAAGYGGRLLFDSGAASENSVAPENRAAMANGYVVAPQILGGSPFAVNTPSTAQQRDFFERYTRSYGNFSCLGVYAADALKLLTSAASQAGTTTPLRIRDELESVPFDGLAGTYVFSTANHGGMRSDALGLFVLQGNGTWLQVG